VWDFDANPAGGQDRIDLRPLGITAASFAAAVTIAYLGDDIRVTVKDGGVIWFEDVDGVGANRITQGDFLLA
jgi:hypothetical protein